MHVEGRQRVAARDHADTFKIGEQVFQLALYFDDDGRARAREQRRIADEHDGVAEPLLGMQQDGLAPERVFAEPERLAQAAPRDAGTLPAPFILRETAAVVVDRQQRQRLVEMRVGEVLVGRDRLAVAFEPITVPAGRLQRLATRAQRLGMARHEHDEAVVAGDRFLVAPDAEQRTRAIHQRLRVVRGDHERFVIFLDRGFRPPEREQRVAAIDPRRQMTRLARQHADEADQRLFGAIEVEQDVAAVGERLEMIGIARQRLVEMRERLGRPLQRRKGEAEIGERIGRRRIDAERRRDQPLRLAGLAALQLQQPEQVQRVELVGKALQNARVVLLRGRELPLPVQRERLLQRRLGLLRRELSTRCPSTPAGCRRPSPTRRAPSGRP